MSVIQDLRPVPKRQIIASSKLEELAFSFLLAICMIQFSGIWYWGASNTRAFDEAIYQPLGVPFRYMVWGSVAGATALYLVSRPYKRLLYTLLPFLPLWGFGLLSSLQGLSPVNSIRTLIFWLLMALGASVAGSTLRPRMLLQILFYSMAAMIVVSTAVSIAVPPLGTMIYGGENVWRGAFAHKNGLGMVAMWTIVVAYLARPTVGNARAVPVLFLAAVCLIFSGSKGSLVVALGAIGYYILLAILARARISTALGAGTLSGSIVAVAILGVLLWIPVTSALGRDPTLTGRTVIWAAYIQQALDSWVLGQGPGSFSGLSAITEKLFQQLQVWGNIKQPHNSFVAAFGDGGIVGFLCYVGGIAYVTFVAPFRTRTPETLACAIGGCMLLFGGLVEGRGVYNASLDMFLVLVLRALAIRSAEPDYPYKAGAKMFASASPPVRLM